MTRSAATWVLSTSVAFLSLAGLVGCGVGNAPTESVGPAFHGSAFGGQQPVTGAHIALFAASSSGYGANVTPLATTTTLGDGTFSISSSYTCPTGSQAYLVATGGNPGLSSPTTDNSAIYLMAALGPCSSIGSATVNINEVTTVAAAYALNGFLPAGGAGLTEAAVVAGTSMPGVATSSTNTQGLLDAFANANNIVNYTTGLAYTATPAVGSSGVVPQAVIHALADILQPCVNAATPSDPTCASLFAAATPPVTGATAPVNVLQAALNIAHYPANNVSAVWSQLSSSPAFATTLTAAPADWTVAVAYTGATMTSTSGLGINSTDTVYVAGTGYLINFTPQGAPISSANILTGVAATDALRYIAFDSANNLFVADGNQTEVYELSAANAVTKLNYNVAPALDNNANNYGVAVDGLGDVWTSSYSKAKCTTSTSLCTLIEFPSSATTGTSPYAAYAPFSSFSGTTVSQPTGGLGGARGLSFDVSKGNIWITSIDDNLGELFNVTPSSNGVAAGGTLTQLTGLGGEVASPATNNGYGTISVAVDKNSQAWFVTSGGPAPSGGSAVAPQLTPVSSAGVVGTGVTGGGMNLPVQVIVDGNNNLFVANSGANSVVEYNTTLAAFESGAAGFLPTAVDSLHTLYAPSYLEADRAGSLWTSSTGNGTTHSAALIQILGVAAPTNPVMSAGGYGVKP